MIYHGQVDGVPTVLAPRPGPMHAGLMFRVGQSDEILSRRGVTHLVEHLALHRLGGQAEYHYNGTTGAIVTYFHSEGTPEEISAFLTGVCDGLAQLPLDRLEREKEILRTEAAGRSGSVVEPLAVWRYGAQDHGLPGYAELGLPMLQPDDLQRWVAHFFTRDNAALWIAGDGVPPGLRLRLPAGQRRPVPPPSSALPKTPAYFPSGAEVIALDGIVRRGAAATAFTRAWERQLYRTLRQEGGYSYAVNCSYDPRGDGFSTITAVADSAPEMQGAALGEFLDGLAALRVGRIAEADVAAAVGKLVRNLDHPDVDAARLPSVAMDLLTGQRTSTLEEVRAELNAVTLDDVRQVAAQLLDTALLMTPSGLRADWAGFTAAPGTSDSAVAGRRIAHRSGSGPEVIVAPDGVSLVGDETVLTARYATTVALLQWPDGARELVGADAIRVRLEPTLHALDAETVTAVDRSVPPLRHVQMPPRTPESIPTVAAATTAPSPTGPRPRTERVVAGVLGFVSTMLSILATLITISAFRNDRHETMEWIAVGVVWLLALLFFVPAKLLRRRGQDAATPAGRSTSV